MAYTEEQIKGLKEYMVAQAIRDQVAAGTSAGVGTFGGGDSTAANDARIEQYLKDNAGQLSDAEFAAQLDQHSQGGSADGMADRFGVDNFIQWNAVMGGMPGGGTQDGTLGTGGGHLTPGGAPGSGQYDPNNPNPGSVGDDGMYIPGTSGGGNTSWDWGREDPFDWNFGGAEAPADYETRYRLGEDSPWGQEGVAGGNKEFYGKQLNNLLGEQQFYKESAIGNALKRQFNESQPSELQSDPWAWANGGEGLPQVNMAGGTADNPTGTKIADWITPGETTNREIIQRSNPDGQYANYNSPNWDATDWGQAANPQDLYSQIQGSSNDKWGQIQKAAMNSAFNEYGLNTPSGGGPTAAAGYALPINIAPR